MQKSANCRRERDKKRRSRPRKKSLQAVKENLKRMGGGAQNNGDKQKN